MKRLLTAFAVAFVGFASYAAQPSPRDSVGKAIFERVCRAVGDCGGLDTGELAERIALEFVGTPYAAGTLEHSPEELRVRLDSTDCILFVEMCTGFALTVKSGNPSYEALADNIRQMRYRDGTVDGYASRIHYTSEWLAQNESRGILREYTRECGREFTQHFSYMTAHSDRYPLMKGDTATIAKIRAVEERLEASAPYCILEGEAIGRAGIKSGDIICFVSKVAGLDIRHVAIAHEVNGEMRYIHASQTAGKVVISERSIEEDAGTGVRAARLSR